MIRVPNRGLTFFVPWTQRLRPAEEFPRSVARFWWKGEPHTICLLHYSFKVRSGPLLLTNKVILDLNILAPSYHQTKELVAYHDCSLRSQSVRDSIPVRTKRAQEARELIRLCNTPIATGLCWALGCGGLAFILVLSCHCVVYLGV